MSLTVAHALRAPPMMGSPHWSSKYLYVYMYILYKCMFVWGPFFWEESHVQKFLKI